tara:strand:- start:1829 stop:2506 length:678 start_codon:yes stop_codon:yes gene_type:complete
MPLELTTLTTIHKNQLESQAPWIWLYELEVAGDPPTRYRLTNFTQSVEYGTASDGTRLVYSPAPIAHGDIQFTAEGGLPTMDITVGVAGPITASTVDAADGYVGQPIRLMLVSSLELENPDAAIVQDGEIISSAAGANSISFRVSAFNLYQLQFPPFVFTRRRCRYIFGSGECGYNTAAAGAGFSTCGKTLTDCEARGVEEASRGLALKHPGRFGGWPGIPRAGR